MKKIVFVLIALVTSISFAQDQKVEVIENENGYEATYYHDNGQIAQHGFFNLDGKLHGTWKSYDVNGNKTAIANYDNGRKAGKWLFWTEDKLTEVDYKNFKMDKVNQWGSKTKLAIRD